MKTIGVVIPIYNTEKYLKECLDSAINQSYTNLEIILVNDGSTDENSLNIAKEYTLKDKRITLFDKKNGGQSTGRNACIEYFSGEYQLKNKSTQIKENSLMEFKIQGNNPYEIYTIYKSYKAFNDEKDLKTFTYPHIDYIIFLDSDDYWKLDCVQRCVEKIQDYENTQNQNDSLKNNEIDVFWFKEQLVDEVWNNPNPEGNIFDKYYMDKDIISTADWVEKQKIQGDFFQFVCFGMINFSFLKRIKLKFVDYAVAEDRMFGILLFLQSSKIYMLNERLYFYRLREGSTCNYGNKKEVLPKYFSSYFNCDGDSLSVHITTYGRMKMLFDLLEYCENNELTDDVKIFIKQTFIPFFYNVVKNNILKCNNIEIQDKYRFFRIDPYWLEFTNARNAKLVDFLRRVSINKTIFSMFLCLYKSDIFKMIKKLKRERS